MTQTYLLEITKLKENMQKIKEPVECLECKNNHLFKDQKQLIRHIKKYHSELTFELYCIKHFYEGTRPLCKCGCGTEMTFKSFANPEFFSHYTTNHWPHNLHTKEVKERIKVNLKKAMMDKYGVDNPMKRPESIAKIAETKLERYGDPNYNNPDKLRETLSKRTEDEKETIKQKLIKTNMDKFGGITFTATIEGKNQVKKTKLERYGDEKYINIEKIKQVKLERHGYECEFSNPEWRRKHNGKTSKIEIAVREKLGAEPKFDFMGKEYDMKLGKYIIEVDGDYCHPVKLENMNLKYQLGNSINDYIKTKNLEKTDFNLVRIQVSTLHSNKSELNFEFILNNRYDQDFSFELSQILVLKEEIDYFKKFDEGNSLKRRVHTLFRFLKVFEPEFIHLIPENALSIWRSKAKIKESISKCFGLFENDPCNVSLENLLRNLEI